MLRNFIYKYEDIEEIIFCWDSDESSFLKKEICPEYKENREDTEFKISMKEQIEKLKQIFYFLGVKQVFKKRIEADDLIFFLSSYFSFKKEKNLIVSSDKDILQVINNFSHVINLQKKKTINLNNFEDIVGVKKESFVDYLCLKGDKVDDIPGVKGVGEEFAKRIVNNFLVLENLYKNEEKVRTMISIGKIDKKFGQILMSLFTDKNKELIERNKKIIKLGHTIDKDQFKESIDMYLKQKNIKPDIKKAKDFLTKNYLIDNGSINGYIATFLRIGQE